VSQGEFDQDELNRQFGLRPYNDVDEIHMYGNEPRVKVRATTPWDEVQMTLHSWEELSRGAFDAFLEQAMGSFQATVDELENGTSELAPWKTLGRRWHLMKKGFSKGRIRWRMETLELLFELLEQIDTNGEFQWDSKQLVNRFIGGKKPAWATVQTKKPDAIRIHLRGEPGKFPMGAVSGLAGGEEVEQRIDWDVVRIDVSNREQLQNARFRDFLRKHHAAFKDYFQR
jgi:excinuclease ABC subunit A